MAFLKITKKHHLDKPIDIKLLVDISEVEAKENNFGDMEFNLLVQNIGQTYSSSPSKDGSVYEFNPGQHFDLQCSEALFTQVSRFKKDDSVTIAMKPNETGGIYWDVVPFSGSSKPEASTTQHTNTNTDLQIRWGMAFNNATRLACTDSELTPAGKVAIVKEIMPKMFEIARGLEDVLEKEQKEKDDNLPF